MNANERTVAAMYESFQRGDVPAILAQLSDDVRFEDWADNRAQRAGVPWMMPRRGKAGAAEFFGLVGAFKFSELKVLSVLSSADQVAVEVVIAAEVPSTGGAYRDEEIHLWSFDASGKVTRFRQYLDTAKHTAVARGER